MKEFDFKFHTVLFDESTGDFEIKTKACEHAYKLVKWKMSDGRIQLRKQCIKCANLEGAAQSQKNVDLSKIPVAIEPASWEDFKEEREMLRERLTRKRREIRFAVMDEYYKTPEWEEKRQKVFKRDNHTCQACLDAPSEQCHHLTYEHFKNEPLFDLVSICKACHEKITLIDRENRG